MKIFLNGDFVINKMKNPEKKNGFQISVYNMTSSEKIV